MDPEDIAKCYFIPKSSIEKAINFLTGDRERKISSNNFCEPNLLKLQSQYTLPRFKRNKVNWHQHAYNTAIHRAIYSHDWNKLLYLLKKSPPWEHDMRLNELSLFFRALFILLVNHPSARAQDLLNDYFHMVCACRSDEEKKALMKLIVTLPEKIVQRIFNIHKNCKWYQEANDNV